MFSAPLVFLIYLSEQIKMFYFGYNIMSLNQCDNQKNYSLFVITLKKRKLKCNWFLHFGVFEIWWGISEIGIIKLISLTLFSTMGEGIEDNEKGHICGPWCYWKEPAMRNRVDCRRDLQYNLALAIESVICFLFLKYFLSRGFPKLHWIEFFAEKNQWSQQQNTWVFRKDTISLRIYQYPHCSQSIFNFSFGH